MKWRLEFYNEGRGVLAHYSIEARYGRYRNESISLNDFYTKNVYSVGMNYRP